MQVQLEVSTNIPSKRHLLIFRQQKVIAVCHQDIIRMQQEDGIDPMEFASNAEVGLSSNSDHYLHRPYIRQETIDAVNANTKVDYQTGQIYDSISKKWVDPSNVELGHTTGNEFAFYRNWAESQGMNQQQFNDFMNNPKFYAWQEIYSNRSHMFEATH